MNEPNEVYAALVLANMPPRNPIPFRELARKLDRREGMDSVQTKVGIDWLGTELIDMAPGQGYQLTTAGRAWRLSWAKPIQATQHH